MPNVLNKYHATPEELANAVYIGRGSPYGNPFIIGKDGTREEVINKHAMWISRQPHLIDQVKMVLKGKDLVCFCSPLPCHGNILIAIANS